MSALYLSNGNYFYSEIDTLRRYIKLHFNDFKYIYIIFINNDINKNKLVIICIIIIIIYKLV